jgi:putative FmdB family regulatory protein
MPRYDFKCPVCLYVFEAIVPVVVTQRQCPACEVNEEFMLADRQLPKPSVIQVH